MSELTPYIAVADARAAIDWYRTALGAELQFEPIVMPDGRIGHAELSFNGALLMVADEHPEIGAAAPRPGQGAAVTLHLSTVAVDALADSAVAHGASLDRGPEDTDHGRTAGIHDPFGHRWLLSQG